MAYRFTTAGQSRVQFGIGALSGYTFGPLTFAVFVKRANTTNYHALLGIWNNAGSTVKDELRANSGASGGDTIQTNPTTGTDYARTWNTSVWTLLVVTVSNAGVPRFHFNESGTWTHAARTGGATTAASSVIAVDDGLFVGAPGPWGGEYPDADIVCAGIKKSDTADLAIEALSRTDFTTWQSFGFDWLVGFDAISTRPAEIARNSVTLVADPPGWAWPSAAPPPPILTTGVRQFLKTTVSGGRRTIAKITPALGFYGRLRRL